MSASFLYDERPAPAHGSRLQRADYGLGSAGPEPDPLDGAQCARAGSGSASPLPEGVPETSDACVGVDGDGAMHLAFASSEGAAEVT